MIVVVHVGQKQIIFCKNIRTTILMLGNPIFLIFHGINIFVLVGKAATGFVTKVQTRVLSPTTLMDF
jgi:hypothetical protein